MNSIERLALWVYGYPNTDQAIEQRHAEIVREMQDLEAPFGWRDLTPPSAPKRKKGSFGSFYELKYPETNIFHEGIYQIRDAKFLYDKAAYDDRFAFDLSLNDKRLDYVSVLHKYFPEVVSALSGYRAVAFRDPFPLKYDDLHEEKLKNLRKQESLDIDGRNNIFTLNPAHYWDAQLCQRALGYGPDEVIRRLEGQVPLVKSLMDGVYVVFNDNPGLSFEEFCAMNDRFKPILGLV